MHITALGHAGLKVETGGTAVLVDPWLSPCGAFQAAWFQYPENNHLLTGSRLSADATIISHEHLDHLDAWFLSTLPSDAPVVIPRYPSPVLRDKLRKAGRSAIIELVPWQRLDFGGLTVFFVSEESPMNHDSAVVLTEPGHSLLDLNDARLTPIQLERIRTLVGGRIDAVALQGAGASWHPMVYDVSPARKRQLAHEKRSAKLGYAAAVIRLLEPGVALPFAGPMCFLDPELFEHNHELDGGVFPDQEQVACSLRSNGGPCVEVLLPGDGWDTKRVAKDADEHWEGFRFADRWEYLSDYQARKRATVDAVRTAYPDPCSPLWNAFEDYFEELISLSPYFNEKIAMRVGFDICGPGGGSWSVDFRPGREGVRDEPGECGYVYRFASRWLAPLLDHRVHWEDFLLSLRFHACRSPDVYNDHLLGLLKFANRQPLDAVEAFERKAVDAERITIEAEGSLYEVQRYCPHAHGDLCDTAEVLAGKRIRCLNHYYEFDLETGTCLNGSAPPLESRRVR